MKYIRTKDGIYEVVGEQKKYFLISLKNIKEDCYGVPCIDKNDIINQANTVEELCDLFIFKDEEGKPRPCYKQWIKETYEIFKDIKGAIWTDEGLIYKAEMKGILPSGEIDWKLL